MDTHTPNTHAHKWMLGKKVLKFNLFPREGNETSDKTHVNVQFEFVCVCVECWVNFFSSQNIAEVSLERHIAVTFQTINVNKVNRDQFSNIKKYIT